MEMKKQKSYRPWDTSSWDFDDDGDDLENFSDGQQEETKFHLSTPKLKEEVKVGAVKLDSPSKLTSPTIPKPQYQPKTFQQFQSTQKEHKLHKKPKINFIINTSKCRHQLDTIRHVIQTNSGIGVSLVFIYIFQQTRAIDKGDMMWFALNLKPDDLQTIRNHKFLFNRYPGSFQLARKRPLAIAMNRMMKLFPEQYDFIPSTFLYPQQSKQLKAYMSQHTGATYLVKTSQGCAGQGIVLINSIKQIPQFMMNKDLIVQRYLTKPLLLKKKKFDLRVYVVYCRMNPINVYVCDEGLARFCTEDYEKPTKKNMKDYFKHLTNYSLNKMSDEYVMPEESSILNINDSSKRTFKSMWKSLEEEGINIHKLKSEMNDTISKVT